jgi:hypothetical protein
MLSNVKVGDEVIRLLSGVIPMELFVTEVTDELIICGPWKFRKDTGGEVDEIMGWDGITMTGSVLSFPEGEKSE